MIYIGIDDTDTPTSRGTNQLARLLVGHIAERFACRWIVRHQLLLDPRVPYTSKNGSASIVVVPRGSSGPSDAEARWLADRLENQMGAEFLEGSDPGLCIAATVPDAVIAFGQRCQQALVTQREAHALAEQHGILLRGLGGTCGGVIGALAAVGLAKAGSDGRVVQIGQFDDDLTGVQPIAALHARGVVVRSLPTGEAIATGAVDVGKKLRPNLRQGQFVLFVEPNTFAAEAAPWRAVKIA